MTHEAIKKECEALALKVERVPATGRHSYRATAPGKLVYWSTSTLGSLLGLPRVCVDGGDTHARSIKEIRYLITR